MTGELRLVADGITDTTYYGNPAIDGNLVVYKSDDGYNDIFLYDMDTGIDGDC